MSNVTVSRLQRWLAYLTLGVVMVSAVMLGANRPVSWTFLSLMVFVLFAVFVIFTRPPALLTRALVPGLLFAGVLVWCAIQLWPGVSEAWIHPYWANVPDAVGRISADPGQGLHILMRYMAYGMVFMIVASAATDTVVATRLVQIIAISGTVFAVYGFYEIATGTNPILGDADTRNLQSTFVNRNNYAIFAAFGVLANLTAYFQLTSRVPGGHEGSIGVLRDALETFYGGAWLYGFGILAGIGALSLTQSRAGAVAGLIGLVVFATNWRRRGTGGMPWGLVIGLGGLVAFVAVTSATGLIRRLLATGDEQSRFEVFAQVIEGIFDRPMLGHGLGAFQEAFRPYLEAEVAFAEWNLAHNSYLENIFEMGAPAAAAFYLALALIVWRIWRGARTRKRNREFVILALACAVVGGLHSIPDFSLQMPANAAVFMAILAVGWAQAYPSRKRG